MDMEELGYFIFMEEQEEEAKQENEEREALMPPVRDRRKFCVIDEPRQYENLRLSQE